MLNLVSLSANFMNYTIYDFFGNLGTFIIIGTYLLLQSERIKSESPVYSVLNAVGAGLILLSLIHNFNLSAFIVEFFWVLLSIYGIFKYFLGRKHSEKK